MKPRQSPNLPTVHSITAGAAACLSLQGKSQGQVVGSTSSGIFIRLAPRWVVFLTEDPHRGPLTINLSSGSLTRLAVGARCQVEMGRIRFSPPALELIVNCADPWKPPAAPEAILSPLGRWQQLRSVAGCLLTLKPEAGLSGLLCGWYRLDLPEAQLAGLERLSDSLLAARRAIETRRPMDLLDPLSALLGFGGGLTPSGDDLVSGVLLGLARYPMICPGDTGRLCGELVERAYTRTTTLSANLIECAVRGEADERILSGLDGALTGVPDARTAADLLSAWGHSSGADVLTGLGLLVDASLPPELNGSVRPGPESLPDPHEGC